MEDARTRLAVAPEKLRRRVDPASLPEEGTEMLPSLVGTLGQPRAEEAIEFGLGVGARGFNLYVSGPEGSGRETTVRDSLTRQAATLPTPPDLVYVYNFEDADRPRALRLPPGRGAGFAADMEAFVEGARREIPRAFDSDDFERRRREALAATSARRAALVDELRAFARERQYNVEITDAGIAAIPLRNGQPIQEDAFQGFSDEERAEYDKRNDEIRDRAGTSLRQIRKVDLEEAERVRALETEVARFAVGPLFEELRQKYADLPDVLAYLAAVEEDLPGHLRDFWSGEEEEPEESDDKSESVASDDDEVDEHARSRAHLARYRVNVLVDHGKLQGAPVIFEINPTYYNLMGRVEYRTQLGSMVTDFRQIKAGAIHRANGGYLVLRAADVLRKPFAWDGLKRALSSGEARIEDLAEELGVVPQSTLLPEAVPLSVKVVLIGPADMYHELYEADPDFEKLFKVKADFSPEVPWNDEGVRGYAAFVARCVRDWGLLHFDRGALARLVEEGGRARESQRKLSTRLRELADLAVEASHWAKRDGRERVMSADVVTAVRKKRYRANLPEELIREWIVDGTIVVETEGARTGQVNGISVLGMSDHAFGRPSRITATVAAGRGIVRSIDHEVELSGPIHAKGILTLSGYLAGRYVEAQPLAVSATITFEQSYDEVEGDSASCAELCALLSALSGLPIDQGVAVTGSVDQRGSVQAVGGVNDKVEGFYAVCKARGLSGAQGVMVPATNVPNLMLDDEVVAAVAAGRFHVWAVRTVDEALELLTRTPAGERGADGQYPAGSLHRRVEDTLRQFAERWRGFNRFEG